MDLVEVADRFGCSYLKMTLEASIVSSEEFLNVDSAAKLFLFADSKNCALLREHALQLVARNAAKVTKTDGWKELSESGELMSEAFVALANANSGCNVGSSLEDQSVSTLRKRAWDQYLRDIDCSRESLVKRLKEIESNDTGDNSS